MLDEFREDIDYTAATHLVNDCGYYGWVEPADLAGTKLYGIVRPDTEELIACVAVMVSGAQAYVDYLSVRQDSRMEGVATYLLSRCAEELIQKKVRVVHTCVSGENAASANLLKRFGARIGWPYISATIKLEDDHGR